MVEARIVRNRHDLIVDADDIRISTPESEPIVDLLAFAQQARQARDSLISIEARLAEQIRAARDAVRVVEDGLAEHERLVRGLRTSVEDLSHQFQSRTVKPTPEPDIDPDPEPPGSARPRLSLVRDPEDSSSVTSGPAGRAEPCRRCAGPTEAGACLPCRDAFLELHELTIGLTA
jgi:hypothetical protein